MNVPAPARAPCERLVPGLPGNICLVCSLEYPLNLKGLRQTRGHSVDLLEEGVDIAVRIAHLPDSTLIAKPVGAVRQIICASPVLLKRAGIPNHPEELTNLHCIHFTGMSDASEWEFVAEEQQQVVSVKSILTCNQVGASLQAFVADVVSGGFFVIRQRRILRMDCWAKFWLNLNRLHSL